MSSLLVRMPDLLHLKLREEAHQRRISMNELCLQALGAYLSSAGTSEAAGEDLPEMRVCRAIREQYSDHGIEGVLLFGSAARAELGADSDIDLLVVLGSPITRDLYRKWDESREIRAALSEFSHPVNPQFVRLPESAAEAGGIWLEVAMEGKILWENGSKIHSRLVEIRRTIAEGGFERAMSHGHSYWIRKKVG
jgi:predicted nucleotidyltransferase